MKKQVSLYVHIPFCVRKCRYCDFNSVVDSAVTTDAYVAGVVAEMENRARLLPDPVAAATLYFGGGTPSLLSPAEVETLVDCAARAFNLTADAEVTMEANPGTVTAASLRGYRGAGVNRLSLGVQSFHDHLLELLGRVHTRAEALHAVAAARHAGFDNLGVDLIHSLPGETLLQWESDLEEVVRLQPEHVSAYALSIEEGTPFQRMEERGELSLPPEEDAAAMLELASTFLGGAGYEHYEIANYARPRYRSRHNQVYWRRGAYLGFGAGAHSFLPSPGNGIRWQNAGDPAEYLRQLAGGLLPVAEEPMLLSAREAMEEFMFLGLRLLEGVEEADFLAEFGIPLDQAFPAELQWLIVRRLVDREGGRVRLAPAAVPVANQVFRRFV